MRIPLAFLIASAALACSSTKSEGVATNAPPAASGGQEPGLNTLTGALHSVERGMITMEGPTGNVRINVDRETQVLRNGVPVSEGIDALREGQQITARYDAQSRRAFQIELQPKPPRQ